MDSAGYARDNLKTLEKNDHDAVKAAKLGMRIAIYRSPDIARFDKRRTWENIKAELELLEEDFSRGAMGVQNLTMTEIINSGLTSMDKAVNIGELTMD